MPRRLISSKEIVGRYRIPYSTVTHYTNMGFLTVISRKGNKRVYDEDEVAAQLEKIKKLINEGYPLRLIKKIMLTGEDNTNNI